MKNNNKLALAGGVAAVNKKLVKPIWPVTLPEDEAAVINSLRKGDLTSLYANGAVEQLETEWAKWIEADYCIAVSNGTAALKLALAALDIGDEDEVIVPALSFIASAIAPSHVGAKPVFVDIDPLSFNIDPSRIEALITKKTKAIIVVHLHGLAADMTAITAIAKKHNLFIVEDAAQAHGATYNNRLVGTLSDVGVFSLNSSKNLPTCGEGGLITTNNARLAAKIRKLRQFGEQLDRNEKRRYLHEDIGWNNKLGGIPAAYTLSQLNRFDADNAKRQINISKFLKRLNNIPGLIVPTTKPGCTHVWHILRFRVNAKLANCHDIDNKLFRLALQRVLRAEGVPVEPYQQRPLPAQPVFASNQRSSMCRIGRELPSVRFSRDLYPVSSDVIEDSFTIQRVHLNPDAGPYLEACADGFEKVFHMNLKQVQRIAQAQLAASA